MLELLHCWMASVGRALIELSGSNPEVGKKDFSRSRFSQYFILNNSQVPQWSMNAALVTLVLSCMATLILYGIFTLVVVVCHDREVDPRRWRWAEVARYGHTH